MLLSYNNYWLNFSNFSKLIKFLSKNELTRVVEEHSKFLAYHRDYVENLSDLHASEVAIKDRRFLFFVLWIK